MLGMPSLPWEGGWENVVGSDEAYGPSVGHLCLRESWEGGNIGTFLSHALGSQAWFAKRYGKLPHYSLSNSSISEGKSCLGCGAAPVGWNAEALKSTPSL